MQKLLHGLVINIVDGDTIDIEITETRRVRLAGIDAPEMHDQDERERDAAMKAKIALAGKIMGMPVCVRTQGVDSFGRDLGWVFLGGNPIVDVEGGRNVNQEMLAEGHAVRRDKK
jgi:endonuclease YncB( thermonuclease family)